MAKNVINQNTSEGAYVYQTLQPRQIRLLYPEPTTASDIEGGDSSITPRYVIKTVDLDEQPAYVAVSYSWEGQTPRHRLDAGDSWVLITDNVLDMLRFWHGTPDGLPLWIDAACINQQDQDEKAVQVRLMAEIYAQAYQVCVSLGEGTPLVEQALACAPLIYDLLASLYAAIRLGQPIDFTQLPSPMWSGLGDLFMSSWFTRVWTMQEAALNPNTWIRMGSTSCKFLVISELASLVQNLHFVDVLFPHPGTHEGDPKTGLFRGAFQLCTMIGVLNEGHQLSDQERLWFWVLLARTKLCSDDRDRIYGLLGLIPESIRRQITVDYSLPFPDVCLQFSRACIDLAGPQELLSQCHVLCAIPGAPSWVPNLGVHLTIGPLSKNPDFAASGTGASVYSVGDEGRTLFLQGRIVDTVKRVGPKNMPWALTLDPEWETATRELRDTDPEWAFETIPHFHVSMPKEMSATILEFEEQCLALANEAYQDPDVALQAHFATLTAEMSQSRPGMPAWSLEDYHAWKKMWLHRQPDKDMVFEYWRPGGDRTQVVSLTSLFEAVEMVLRKRAYFSTEKCRTGVGSSLADVGDLVVVFKGLKTPFLVRKSEHERPGGGQAYRLMDEAYVHGIMRGETDDDADSDSDVEFAIV